MRGENLTFYGRGGLKGGHYAFRVGTDFWERGGTTSLVPTLSGPTHQNERAKARNLLDEVLNFTTMYRH